MLVESVMPTTTPLQRIFGEALSLSPDARAAYVSRACGGDINLLRAAQALLAVDDVACGRRIESPFQQPSPSDDPEQGSSDDQTGQDFGPYRLVRLLGTGGMGRVYLAERRDVRKSVALKVLDGVIRGTHMRQRFLLERNVLARLDDPNIARFLDAASVRMVCRTSRWSMSTASRSTITRASWRSTSVCGCSTASARPSRTRTSNWSCTSISSRRTSS
jgi:serine/threonine protein kinase